nr:hypothetical protein [uncultured Rhodopila sp.]
MPDSDIDPIDLAAVIADLRRRREALQRMQDETAAFVAAQRKSDEKRDRWILPLSLLLTVVGSIIIGSLIGLPEYLRLFGRAP